MTDQNMSHAVMARRHEPQDSLDDFPTPPWATRALIEHVIRPVVVPGKIIWEPACGRGDMVEALWSVGLLSTYGSDIHKYNSSSPYPTMDFLSEAPPRPVDWVITNPPFKLAEEFVHRGLEVADRGVALLVRTQFLEGVGRYNRLFKMFPPDVVAQFSERVPMQKGRIYRQGSTATAYCWCVWVNPPKYFTVNPPVISIPPNLMTRMIWIPPCRKALEKDGDYKRYDCEED